MSDFLKNECDLEYFHKNGYYRKKCKKCGAFYWTLKKDSELCGDQPCVKFSFIEKPLGKKPLNISEVRDSFLCFFEKNNHSRLNYPVTGERCPVIARWRSDIYLTIASIADFQPHVTSGEVPPPENPLVISQPCIRLNDLEEVGVSGRHLTMFEMMGHHAFNKNIDEVYFKEETVRLCDDFFVNHIGIPREEINYKEQLWFGGGNAGPCLEVLAAGLEIATLVFMNMREDEKGDFEIEGKKYSPNPLNIVDTGYGLERIVWCTQGTKNVYEAVLPEIVKYVIANSEKTDDDTSIYSLSDHSKCLSFMLGDGIVPSNVKAGYLARLIIRRSIRFIEKIGFKYDLKAIVFKQLELLKQDFPSLIENKKQIGEILDIETKRYYETLSKGENLVKKILKQDKTINVEKLIMLYDTHGMPPSIVKKIAEKSGSMIKIPDNFESMVAELHSHETKKHEENKKVDTSLPPTERLYYNDHYKKTFNAKVLWKRNSPNGTEIILDKTTFYPEGGGQPSDIGVLTINGNEIQVKHVDKNGESIIHLIDGDLEVGDEVQGRIDWDHRYTLMKHHTGTHVVNGALRKYLGNHVWQAGSQLGLNEARFDFSHYDTLDENDLKEIEQLANDLILENVNVEKLVLDRNTAEKRFGFRLYQGGVPPGNSIRVLNIPNVDVEACGGTHLNNIGEIERIKIIKIERNQDGVNRVVFAAGKMADEYQKKEKEIYNTIIKTLDSYFEITVKEDISEQLKKVSNMFSVPNKQLNKTIKRFLKETELKNKNKVETLADAALILFNEWKKTQKDKKNVSGDELDKLIDSAEKIDDTDIKIIIGQTSSDAVSVGGNIIQKGNYVVHLHDGKKLVSMASDNVEIDLRKIAPEIGNILGGSGGGKPRMTQCGGPNKEKIKEALEKAKKLTINEIK